MKRDRILPKVSEPSIPSASTGSAAGAVAGAGGGSVAVVASGAGKPLNGMRFVVIGKMSQKKSDLAKVIAEHGAKLVAAVDDKVAACISTKGELRISLL